jgi:integrase
LPELGVKWLRELHGRAAGSDHVFPARRLGRRDLGHVALDTLNVALARIDHGLEPFTLHDLRRTLRTQLSALNIAPHIAERCLNHKRKGIQATYDRHDYLDERRGALERCVGVLGRVESKDHSNVVGMRRVA